MLQMWHPVGHDRTNGDTDRRQQAVDPGPRQLWRQAGPGPSKNGLGQCRGGRSRMRARPRELAPMGADRARATTFHHRRHGHRHSDGRRPRLARLRPRPAPGACYQWVSVAYRPPGRPRRPPGRASPARRRPPPADRPSYSRPIYRAAPDIHSDSSDRVATSYGLRGDSRAHSR